MESVSRETDEIRLSLCARETMHYSPVNNKQNHVRHHENTRPLDIKICSSLTSFSNFVKILAPWKMRLLFPAFVLILVVKGENSTTSYGINKLKRTGIATIADILLLKSGSTPRKTVSDLGKQWRSQRR